MPDVPSSLKNLNIPHRSSPLGKNVTVSMGVATVLPTKEQSPADLISAADRALYSAKREGRNRIKAAGMDSFDDIIHAPAIPF